jgi:plastocyanin
MVRFSKALLSLSVTKSRQIWKAKFEFTYCKLCRKYIYCFCPIIKKERYLKKISLIPLFIIIFILSACGGGPSTTMDVTFAEFTFTPDTFTVPAGQEITVNATNSGAVVHDLVIMKFGETVGDNYDEEDKGNVFWEIKAGPGASVTGTFTAPTEPGEYQIVCGTPGHFISGMVGKLIVVAAE